MVFTMPCWRATISTLLLLFGLTCAPLASAALSGDVQIRNPQLELMEEGYVLSADITLEFGNKLEEALARGLPLYFVFEFEMSRPRWYWIEDKRFSRSLSYRLHYHALTRQYRLSNGVAHQSFTTLEEALRYLIRVHNWLVMDRAELGALKSGETYSALFRFRLDSSQLPKPLQVNVLFARDWELSGETRWTHTVTDIK